MENENKEENNIEDKVETKTRVKKRPYMKQIFGGFLGGLIACLIIFTLVVTEVVSIPSSFQQAKDIGNSAFANEQVTDETFFSDDVPSNLAEVSEAVVGIINMQQRDVWTPNEEAGSGSGIIYKKDGDSAYVVTNKHVIQDAQNIDVVLENDERIAAEIVGADPLTDLAVLKIDGSSVNKVAQFGDSEQLTVGETVVAIGNPLGMDFAGSVTKGIISGLDRSVPLQKNNEQWMTEVIQTDAAINPGNSGGALVNQQGEVIGINTMKIANEAIEGIGLAIPMAEALPIIEQLEQNGTVERPYIGISTVNMNEVPSQYKQFIQTDENTDEGVVVAQVEEGSPASKAGLQQFDVITTIDKEPMQDPLDIRKYIYNNKNINETIQITFQREGKEQSVTLTLNKQSN